MIAPPPVSATEHLVEVARKLSLTRDLDSILAVVRRAARELTGADGASFVLREGDQCFYADEDAIAPLWKGRRFPIGECISGWTMLNQEAAVIEDVRLDPRIPQDAYRPTFVRSLAMVPIRVATPVGAIGVYWAAAHRATDGEVKLLGALADLTSVALDNVQLYSELQLRMREAEHAVGARDEFISLAAHELRTPLTALQLQLQNLEALAEQNAARVDRRFAERTGRAVSVVRRLAGLVDSLFDASLTTYGGIPLTLEDFDLSEAAREVVERFAGAARRAQCELKIEAQAPVHGRWDRMRIEQVLTNLLSNALKYGAGKPIVVLVESRPDGAHLEVRDQGVGIAPDVAEHLFERFGRAGPVTQYAGLGLGLYLARRVIEAHGGRIGFQSNHGAGSTFMVELPVSTAIEPRTATLAPVTA